MVVVSKYEVDLTDFGIGEYHHHIARRRVLLD